MHRRSAVLYASFVLSASGMAFALGAARVVEVGSESASAEDIAAACARVPPFQWAALASDDAGRKRVVVERRVVPGLLALAEAKTQGLDQQPRVAERRRELLAREMESAIERDASAPASNAEVAAYFAAHRARFETPRRLRIWRILVDEKALALQIIEQASGAGGPARWSALSREHSLDTATKLRDGDLGFVRPDGSTETPRLRVDPALFRAVDALAEGQIAQTPVREAGHFAVVWRRGSLPAIERTAEQEAGAIRAVLRRERVAEARKKLLEDRRRERVKLGERALLETLPDSMFAEAPAEGSFPARPLPSGSAAPAAASTPVTLDRGTR